MDTTDTHTVRDIDTHIYTQTLTHEHTYAFTHTQTQKQTYIDTLVHTLIQTNAHSHTYAVIHTYTHSSSIEKVSERQRQCLVSRASLLSYVFSPEWQRTVGLGLLSAQPRGSHHCLGGHVPQSPRRRALWPSRHLWGVDQSSGFTQ